MQHLSEQERLRRRRVIEQQLARGEIPRQVAEQQLAALASPSVLQERPAERGKE